MLWKILFEQNADSADRQEGKLEKMRHLTSGVVKALLIQEALARQQSCHVYIHIKRDRNF
jgi:hypothetical protein